MDLELIITPEIISSSIEAAFDSVDLIHELILYSPDDTNLERLERNISHLKIMIEKNWFISNLTSHQRVIIDSTIKDGTDYLENNK